MNLGRSLSGLPDFSVSLSCQWASSLVYRGPYNEIEKIWAGWSAHYNERWPVVAEMGMDSTLNHHA